jgi:pyruvate ferredoxin oxidoreductase alpha subunit
MKKVIETSEAVAIAAKLCKPDVVGIYPITPQTHIPERIADMVYDGEADIRLINVESEHSALSACIGAQLAGSRTFTATASQGLALMHEVLFVASGLRLPIVMAVANRALSAPINIWNDHQDSIASRDSGWMQFFVESAQEAFDTVIMAYKIAEHKNVLTPAMVCLDGFTLSHVYEPVDIIEQAEVDKFLPKYSPLFKLDTEKPMTFGPIGLPNSYMQFKQQQHDAMHSAVEIIKTANDDFKKEFGRSYGNGLLESYKMEDAEYAVVCMGTICGTARVVVDDLRKSGKKAGMIKIKSFRPFPEDDLINAAKKLKSIAVIDRDISIGQQGALFTEARSTLYSSCGLLVHGFIAGLGGRDVTKEQIMQAFEKMMNAKKQITGWLY